jgi:hypothetical protein
MRFLGIALLTLLSACQAPVAKEEREVPLRFYRWDGQAFREAPAEGKPLRLRVHLYRQGRQGREASALLRAEGGELARGVMALQLLSPAGEVLGEAYREGRASAIHARALGEAPLCALYLVSLSPDWEEEESLSFRSYEASGRVCEGGR